MRFYIIRGAAALALIALAAGCSDTHPSAPTPVTIGGRIPAFAGGGLGPKSILANSRGLDGAFNSKLALAIGMLASMQ